MKNHETSAREGRSGYGGRLRMPRTRGAASGLLLILLGAWGAAVPFVGPSFDFGYSLGGDWTAGRGWLQVLPGAVTAIGGVLLLISRNRATAMLGGWLSVVAGAWFVVGRAFAGPLNLGAVGTPVADTDTKRVWLELSYFYGLGALVVFLGALALGRLSVRTKRDLEYANRPVPATTVAERDERSDAAPVDDTRDVDTRDGDVVAPDDSDATRNDRNDRNDTDVTPDDGAVSSDDQPATGWRARVGKPFRRNHRRTTPV